MPILLGAVADDFTGATDLCNTVVKGGMGAVQLIGVPEGDVDLGDAAMVTIALKSRTAPVADAVAQSRAACAWLKRQGAAQILFKYCSTFDSTPSGNIGPVADALLADLTGDIALVCPAFPETGRTIFKGHLFVGDRLLSDTHMATHPLTPMTNSNLIEVMAAQSRHKVGLVERATVARGSQAVRERFDALRAQGISYAVADAIEDDDLRTLGRAALDHPLITGGSGIALGLPDNFRNQGMLDRAAAADVASVDGLEAVIAGSCSAATLAQIAHFRQRRPALALDPLELADGFDAGSVGGWAQARLGDGPVLVYASADQASVAEVQRRLGRQRAGRLVERALADVARVLITIGVRRLVVAGGETSGAVVQALGVRGLRIGPQIDPGVPACTTIGDNQLAIALKSGNFGGEDFLTRAFDVMPGSRR